MIDEISMVGADTLLTILRPLCDIISNTQPFEGISILAVGDLLQLPAVAQKHILQNLQVKCRQYMVLYGKLTSKFLNLQKYTTKEITTHFHLY